MWLRTEKRDQEYCVLLFVILERLQLQSPAPTVLLCKAVTHVPNFKSSILGLGVC